MNSVQKAALKLNSALERSVNHSWVVEDDDAMREAQGPDDVDIPLGIDQSQTPVSAISRIHDSAHPSELSQARNGSGSKVNEGSLEIASGPTRNDGALPVGDTKRRLEIPLERFRARGMISPDAPKSQIAEEFRNLKRSLLTNMANALPGDSEYANVVMVTSCVEGEGKTFSAINLAMSLAMERDKSVLHIDTDVAKATASTMLGFSPEAPGLIDTLLGDPTAIDEVIWQTNIDKLSCIPVGAKSEHATELLASDGMRELIRSLSLSDPDRIIVFDAPPILVTSEALVLAQQVGQIVFVVAAETTTHGMVADALNRMQVDARVGLLLNKSRKKIGTRYGYGYGYGYDNRPTLASQ